MRISELIESLNQRHTPEYYDEHTYYNDLCYLIDKLDAYDSNILSNKIRQENDQYAEHNLDYESYLQGLIGYNYVVKKYNLHDIVDKVIIPELDKGQNYLLEMFNKKED